MSHSLVVGFFNNISSTVIFHLLNFLWQSSLVLSTGLLLVQVFKKYSAGFRHTVLLISIVGILLLPLLSPLVPEMATFNIQVFKEHQPENINSIYQPSLPGTEFPFFIEFGESGQDNVQVSRVPLSFYSILFMILCLGSLFGITRWIFGLINLFKIKRNCSPLKSQRLVTIFQESAEQCGFSKNSQVLTCKHLEAPITIGFFKPIILLPEKSVRSLAVDEFRSIVLHEISHLKRFDHITIPLLALLRSILYFHPLAWLTIREMALLAEEACDERVLQLTRQPLSYVKLLTMLAEESGFRSSVYELSVSVISSRHALIRRVEAVLSRRKNPMKKTGIFIKSVFVTVLIVALFSAAAFPLTSEVETDKTDEIILPEVPQGLPGGIPLANINKARLSARYGEMIHPFSNKKVFHEGVDFAVPEGTPVFASADGEVAVAEEDKNRGLHVSLQHKNDYETWYSHLSSISVEAGENVKTGQKIGEVGNTGLSTGPHLHYAIIHDGEPVDPMDVPALASKFGNPEPPEIPQPSEEPEEPSALDVTISFSQEAEKPARLNLTLQVLKDIDSLLQIPQKAIEDEVDGTATIELIIDKDGNIVNMKILDEEPKGYNFGESAIKTMKILSPELEAVLPGDRKVISSLILKVKYSGLGKMAGLHEAALTIEEEGEKSTMQVKYRPRTQ